jgi:ferredoxin
LFGVRPPSGLRTAPPVAASPRIDDARCARRREGDRGCRACVLACPTEAIWIGARGRLRLQEIDCVACGACASACPTQTIAMPDAVRDDLQHVLAARADGRAVRIGCRLGPDGDAGSFDARVPCLAALHPEALAARLVAAPGIALELDASPCGRCRFGALLPLAGDHVARAVALARHLGVEPDVRFVSKATLAPAPTERRLSRRDLFGRARDAAAERLAEHVVRAVLENDHRSGDPLPHRPALLAAVRARVAAGGAAPSLPVAGAFYVDWDVSDRCDGCASVNGAGPRCASRCPTGAWRVAHEAGAAALTHDVAACTGCGVCQRSCPQDALTPRPALATADAGRVAKRSLAVVRCRSCQRKTPVGNDGMCANCRKRLSAAPAGR